MRRILFPLATFSIAALFVFYGPGGITRLVNQDEPVTILIEKGDSTLTIAKTLHENHLIDYRMAFLSTVAYLKLQKKTLKHGEYLVEPHTTLWGLVKKIADGDVVIHHITIPEGLTVHEIIKKLEDISILKGDINHKPEEGALLPQTYDYQWGETREQLMGRMAKAMENLKQKVQPLLSKQEFLRNWSEVLNLAAIVEKETGIGSERALVASVYLNRLKIGMPLQADPTVIYAATNGETSFYRPIFKSDLTRESPYNTYLQRGLPPTPIACPGEASIMAVLQPAETGYLYFVADGSGGHVFSSDLKAHNQHVKEWRMVEKEKKSFL